MMKRLLMWIFCAVTSACCAQAPIGVCINNDAQTISNGMIAPVPGALINLCTAGSTASNCLANKVSLYTTTALTTQTSTNPFVSDSGGNYYFCAPVGHYGMLISGAVGIFFVPDITLSDDLSKGGTVTGNWVVTGNITDGALAGSSGKCAQFGAGGILSATSFPCGSSSTVGTVTSVTATGFPSWLSVNVPNSTTNPVITAAVGAIPNSALQNPSITINSTTCTLGSSCNTTGGTARTCNSNGCYRVDPDGTVYEWGTVSVAPSGTAQNTASITFPYVFPTAVPTVTINSIGIPGSGDPTTPIAAQLSSTSTSGASAYMAKVIVASAGGGIFTNTISLNWFAIGY